MSCPDEPDISMPGMDCWEVGCWDVGCWDMDCCPPIVRRSRECSKPGPRPCCTAAANQNRSKNHDWMTHRKSPTISVDINPAAERMFRRESGGWTRLQKSFERRGHVSFGACNGLPTALSMFCLRRVRIPNSSRRCIRGNILPHHALQEFRAMRTGGFALQNHLPIFELANEVEIRALIVNPCLFPLAGSHVEEWKHWCRATVRVAIPDKILLHHAPVEHPRNAIRTVPFRPPFCPGQRRDSIRPARNPVVSAVRPCTNSPAPACWTAPAPLHMTTRRKARSEVGSCSWLTTSDAADRERSCPLATGQRFWYT